MKKLLRILFLFLILGFFLVPQAKAADLNIDCPTSPAMCGKSGLDPLFSNSLDGFWYPGKSITKTLNLKNSSTETQEMAIKGTRTSDFSILENVMHISIVRGTAVIWSGSVADFYGQDKVGMGTFAPGANFDYDFTVSMSPDADNNYQNKKTVFNLTLGFWGEPVTTATPTPLAGGGGGGTVLGGETLYPICSDTAPAGAPILVSAVPSGSNQVTLTWTEGEGPLTYYLVSYRTLGGQQYGNPNIGGPGVTSYIVKGLSGGTTYYFKVRAGNGCMPGSFSNELAATPGGGVTAGPALGFQEGVLGTATNEAELNPTLPGDTLGAIKEGVNKKSFWSMNLLWGFLLLALLFLLYRLLKKKKFKIKFKIKIPS